ncbi:MAG: macrolide ABC transporter ATP-binding protein [Bacteroidetes bacterium]|nr:MAG: macrolide ABC transporter ATP-binding protein [Bacteroidota bacterium]
MIILKEIRKSYTAGSHKLEVLKGLSSHIKKGEMVAIMGSSGSGKSTLLNILGLLDDFDSGDYELAGTSMAGLNERAAAKYRSRFLGFVFQSFNLIGFKSALENVALPLYYQSVPRKVRNLKAMEYLKKVGLEDWANHLPNQMSGGQKQRVAIARALVGEPKVILADEPTGALDSTTSHEVMDLLRKVNKEGITMIIVTHESDIAALCDRTIHLVDGQIDFR